MIKPFTTNVMMVTNLIMLIGLAPNSAAAAMAMMATRTNKVLVFCAGPEYDESNLVIGYCRRHLGGTF